MIWQSSHPCRHSVCSNSSISICKVTYLRSFWEQLIAAKFIAAKFRAHLVRYLNRKNSKSVTLTCKEWTRWIFCALPDHDLDAPPTMIAIGRKHQQKTSGIWRRRKNHLGNQEERSLRKPEISSQQGNLMWQHSNIVALLQLKISKGNTVTYMIIYQLTVWLSDSPFYSCKCTAGWKQIAWIMI
jgi:hypothetical protein